MSAAQTAIATWLLSALVHWTPVPAYLAEPLANERIIVASALVDLVYSPDEPPVPMFQGPDARARTALLLGSIAAHESGLLPRIAAGKCFIHECDHGTSTGIAQVKLGPHGMALIPGAGYRYCDSDTVGCLTKEDLADNVPAQLRVALHILRSDGLKSYTGEASSVDAPSARRREVAASLWAMRHPPPASDAQVLGVSP